MNRRTFLLRSAACGATFAGVAASSTRTFAQAEISDIYSESAAILGLSPDGSREVSIRIARFPRPGHGSIWIEAASGKDAFAGAFENLELGSVTGATPVKDDKAAFLVTGPATARLERDGFSKHFTGSAEAKTPAHATGHPPLGPGDTPIVVAATFEAWHPAQQPRPGRTEIMGTVRATIETPTETFEIAGPGGWHEQTGDRARFAPAFTYFKVMGNRFGVLASRTERADWGFVFVDGLIEAVRTFTVAPAADARDFRVETETGRRIVGVATVIRAHSTPVEGQRRPGTTVAVTSDIGPMVGRLNDWAPQPT